MKAVIGRNRDTFETGCEFVDVTSLHRPDTAWRQTDKAGHVHQWHTPDGPAVKPYSPSTEYSTPTLKWVKDGEAYWPDDDQPHDVGHHECAQCGEPIEPRYRADEFSQFVPGLRWYKINGEDVSEKEYKQRYAAATEDAKGKPK